jgi:hypothetical protein
MAYMGGGGYGGLGNESWLVVESCSRFGNKACERPLPNKHLYINLLEVYDMHSNPPSHIWNCDKCNTQASWNGTFVLA